VSNIYSSNSLYDAEKGQLIRVVLKMESLYIVPGLLSEERSWQGFSFS